MHTSVCTLGRLGTVALVAAGVFSLALEAAAQQAVTWTSNGNVAIRGNMLEKISGCEGCDDAGAISRQSIRSGDGYAEFRVGDPYTFVVAGLTGAPGTPRFNQIDFAFRFNGNGWADVLERGAYQQDSDTAVYEGDTFGIAVEQGRVQYFKNGTLIHESQQPARYPLVFATALGSTGASVADVRMGTGNALAMGGLRNPDYGNQDRYADMRDAYGRLPSFATLDRNRDGIISQLEWSGSRVDFDDLDANRDRRLTRQELAYANDSPGSVGTSGRQIRIDPRQPWVGTGLRVQAGDTIAFDANGTIQMSTNPADTATPSGSPRNAAEAPMQGASAGTLLARIGYSAPIEVGAHRTVRAPASGEIFLQVNDDYLEDNTGDYYVSIEIQPR